LRLGVFALNLKVSLMSHGLASLRFTWGTVYFPLK
jgi:hypothetical protein